MDDKPQGEDGDTRAAGASLRGHNRRPDSPPENFISAAQRKLGEVAGDLTNNFVGAAAHIDVAHKFADPITPALARQYVKGRAIVQTRAASGIAADDTNGLSGSDAAAVIAYQKVHDSLPAQIPLVDRSALLRHAETIIEQKASKASPQPEVPRPIKPARAVSEVQTQPAFDKQAKQTPGRSVENRPSAAANKVEKSVAVSAKAGENREQPISKPDSVRTAKSDQKPDQKPDQIKNSPMERPAAQAEPSLKIFPKPHEPASPVLKARSEERMEISAQKSPGELRLFQQSIKSEKSVVPKEEVRSQRSESKLSREYHLQTDTKHDLVLTNYKAPAVAVFLPIAESQFVKALGAPSVKNIAFARELNRKPDHKKSPEPHLSISLAAPMARQAALSKIFPQAGSGAVTKHEAASTMMQPPPTARPPVAGQPEKPLGKLPEIPVTGRILDNHIDHDAARIHPQVHPQVHISESSTGHVNPHLPDHNVGHIVKNMPEHIAEHIAEHISGHIEEYQIEHLPEHLLEHLPEHLSEHHSDNGLPNSIRPIRIALKGVADKAESGDKYITGTEFAFVAIMALASTARAKPGQNTAEEVLRQAHRQFTMIEDNPWPTTILPSSESVLADAQTFQQPQIKDAPPALPAKTTIGSAKTPTVIRPQILAQSGDDLSEMAVSLFHDERLGHLIADLNADKTIQSYEQNARIVVIRTRQKLTLPAYQDVLNYAQQLIKIGEIPLITVVETSAMDKELLAESLSPMLGISSPNRDPLQG